MSLQVPRRVVIDPNVLISGAITPHGASARIIALIDSGVLIAVASPKLVEELAAVLRRPKFRRYLNARATEDFIAEFTALADPHSDPADVPAVSLDPKDDYLIALAQVADADALVSGDTDLHDLPVPDLRVLTPRALLDQVDSA